MNMERGHVCRLRQGQEVASRKHGRAYVLAASETGVVLALVAANGIDTGRTMYLYHGEAELLFRVVGG